MFIICNRMGLIYNIWQGYTNELSQYFCLFDSHILVILIKKMFNNDDRKLQKKIKKITTLRVVLNERSNRLRTNETSEVLINEQSFNNSTRKLKKNTVGFSIKKMQHYVT